MKTFCTFFLHTKNVLLVKPEGMIPYTLNKEFDYDSYIISYNEDDYEYLKNTVSGLKMKFIEKKYPLDLLNIFNFLKNNSQNIDVLMLFHHSFCSVFTILIYKLFNKEGIVYLRSDADTRGVNILTKNLDSHYKKIRFFFNSYFFIFFQKHFVDWVSIENKEGFNKLVKYDSIYQKKLFYSPNGINIVDIKEINKINQILTVGRLGTYQKATEILLESFKNLNNKSNWILKLVGPIEEDFGLYIDNFLKNNPELKNSIQFLGNISDRTELSKLYAESKIFCLPSRFESYGIVLAEAAYFGDYIISTNVGVASEIINITGYGSLMEVDNCIQLTEILQNFIENENNIYRNPKELKNLISSNLNYENICVEINKKLIEADNKNKLE